MSAETPDEHSDASAANLSNFNVPPVIHQRNDERARSSNRAPSPEVKELLAERLMADTSRLGEVYRGLRNGQTADEIAESLGVSTSNFVWNYTQMIRALLDGELPSAPTVALGVSRKLRSYLRGEGSSEVVQYLEACLAELELRANNVTARAMESEVLQEQTEEAEDRNEIGIYIYALPHYLRYPTDPATGRTLMKVGRSGTDVITRFRSQTRTTALPEEPVLLRVYATDPDSNAATERQFHRLLVAADHSRNSSTTAGTEWFVTSTRFTDEVARALELPIRVVNEGAIDGE